MADFAIGIDLGTTFSAVAVVNDRGVPEVLTNTEGDRITPSVVLFDADQILVGTHAKNAAVALPDNVAEFVKRHMGETDYRFSHNNRDYTAEEISSFILAKLKKDAEARLGHPVTHAVITVPAYFTDVQRRATLKAGQLADLEVLKLVNEPTAAAFAYGLQHAGTHQRVLVYDLGGGTFDVTLVDIDGQDIRVVATDGDHRLGGKDWDDRLIDYAANAFVAAHGSDPREDSGSLQDLRQKCVSAKISLTQRPRVNIFIDHKGTMHRQAITRQDFETAADDLLQRTRQLTQNVLDAAKASAESVDVVVLAGGSTRMPMVRNLLGEMFGAAPATDINPDEAICLGAALTAAIETAALQGVESPVDIRTHDVTSHALGMVTYRDGALKNSVIIPKNTPIPAEKSRTDFATTHDNQSTIDLWLVQGEEPDPTAATVLGHFEFYGLVSRPAGETRLSVLYRYNANGIVEVEATDLETEAALPHRLAADTTTLDDIANNRVPTQIALLIDCSGSMYGPNISATRTAAKSFVDRTLSTPNRQIALVAFPGGVKANPTSDANALHLAIDGLTPIGSTPLDVALGEARSLLRPRAGVQRVYVLMTDGHPDNPDATRILTHDLKGSGARILAVGVGPEVERSFLRTLASSPEDFLFCNDAIEIEGAFLNLATELS